MSIKKFRSDSAGTKAPNGSVPYYTEWMGGPTLAEVRNCPSPFGPRTVYVTSLDPIGFSTIAGACSFRGKTVRGMVKGTPNGYEFIPRRITQEEVQ